MLQCKHVCARMRMSAAHAWACMGSARQRVDACVPAEADAESAESHGGAGEEHSKIWLYHTCIAYQVSEGLVDNPSSQWETKTADELAELLASHACQGLGAEVRSQERDKQRPRSTLEEEEIQKGNEAIFGTLQAKLRPLEYQLKEAVRQREEALQQRNGKKCVLQKHDLGKMHGTGIISCMHTCMQKQERTLRKRSKR